MSEARDRALDRAVRELQLRGYGRARKVAEVAVLVIHAHASRVRRFWSEGDPGVFRGVRRVFDAKLMPSGVDSHPIVVLGEWYVEILLSPEEEYDLGGVDPDVYECELFALARATATKAAMDLGWHPISGAVFVRYEGEGAS